MAEGLTAVATLWAEGRSLNAIADELRFSRGVLAGRIHRARKGGDPRFPARPAPLKKAVVARPRSRGKPAAVTPSPPGPKGDIAPRRYRGIASRMKLGERVASTRDIASPADSNRTENCLSVRHAPPWTTSMFISTSQFG
jgi:hypothetical protein